MKFLRRKIRGLCANYYGEDKRRKDALLQVLHLLDGMQEEKKLSTHELEH
jgi:hypothetical protein